MRCLLLLILIAACDTETATPVTFEGPRPEPVAKGDLRVRALRPKERWEGAWLESEGWEFFGYELEAGSDGDVAMTWSTGTAEIAQVRCALKAHEPVSIVYGVRSKPPMRAETIVECPACATRQSLRGTSLPESITCKRCKTPVPVNLDWHSAPARELRIMMRGKFARKGHSKGLTMTGQVYSTEFGEMVWLSGKIRARDVPVDAGGVCDPVAIMRNRSETFRPGLHEPFSRRIYLPAGARSSSSVSRKDDKLEFHHSAGNVKIEGTHEGYRILVDGREMPLTEYPYPVWDFILNWRP